MQFAVAFAGLALTWLILRRQAGPGSLVLLGLDLAPILLGWFALAAIVHRPITAAVVIFAAGAGLAVTDAVKRATLREPLVFADRAELLEVVRHPRLYLPFAGPLRIVGGGLAALAAAAALLWFEPPAFDLSPLGPVALAIGCVRLPVAPPLLPLVAGLYRRLGITGNPAADMRRHGFLACLIAHATIAREERVQRRTTVPPFPAGARPGGPVVLVQIESFFDARRLGPAIPAGLLPGLDRLRATAMQWGTLSVPSWGANTVRSEFAALTGIPAETLGLDHFNPYERFALERTRSLAWQMKAAGYRTICLHPFDKRFYARHRVMPQLGFDEFRGLDVFPAAARAGLYVSDEAVALEIARIVREEGPRVFVFAMTMANHGPWDGPPALGQPACLGALPDGAALQHFLTGLQASDRMFAPIMDAMPADGLLAIYGDHQPSLPAAFAALGHADKCTDYAVWRPHAASGPARPLAPLTPLAIEDLPALILSLQAAA